MSRIPLALTVAAAAALTAPAAAAPPNLAAWSGTATVAQCDTWVCLVGTSDTCVAAGVDGAPESCSVTLEGRWLGTCDGVGTGSLVVTGANGDSQWANATLVASGGTVTFVARYAFLFDRTAVVATGVVEGGCAGGAWHGAFGGRGL